VAYFVMPYNVLALFAITHINMDSLYTSKHMKKWGEKTSRDIYYRLKIIHILLLQFFCK
jgi:hypothetical protein